MSVRSLFCRILLVFVNHNQDWLDELIEPKSGVRFVLSRLRRIFYHVPPDVEAVSRTSRLLGIGPFAVFTLAHERWYGEAPATKTLEPIFVRYLFDQTAPTCVRHFTRLVAFQAENGRFDRSEYGLPALAPETLTKATYDRWNLVIYAFTLGAIFFIVPGIAGV